MAALERQVLNAAPIVGTVLRYGHLYGPGTGTDRTAGASPLHVEAAAHAALLALAHSPGGIYNIAEDRAEVSSDKARRELGWRPDMRASKETRARA